MVIEQFVVEFVIVGVGSVVWYLLKKQNTDQEGQIAMLFKKHDDDVAKLAALELRIAEDHYRKGELDVRFDRLEVTMRTGLESLGTKFDAMTNSLHELNAVLRAHVALEDRRKVQD